jgi:hypothetical protein
MTKIYALLYQKRHIFFISGFVGRFFLLCFLNCQSAISFRLDRVAMQNVEKDLFSKETLLQHLPNADDREYLKFDCNNKAEGKCFLPWV